MKLFNLIIVLDPVYIIKMAQNHKYNYSWV